MPIMCIYSGVPVTPAQYDAIRAEVGWEDAPPPGAISHAIGFGPDGATEVNLWESEALFRDYLVGRLMPAIQRLGIDLPFDPAGPRILEAAIAVGDPAEAYWLPRAVTRPLQPA